MKKEIKFRKDFHFPSGDLYQRVDYLLKISKEIYKINPKLSRIYAKTLKTISKRNVLRL